MRNALVQCRRRKTIALTDALPNVIHALIVGVNQIGIVECQDDSVSSELVVDLAICITHCVDWFSKKNSSKTK